MAYRWAKTGLLVIGLIIFLAGPAARAADPGKVWPMAAKPALSSSFGEFRGGHLHAGIDVRSFGKDGIPCRAVADGYITRIRASIFGYGKALYLRTKAALYRIEDRSRPGS